MLKHEPFSDPRAKPKPSKRLEGKPLVTYVLAGTRAEYEHWIHHERPDPTTAKNSIYLKDAKTLFGKTNYLILKYGTWRERSDLKKIEAIHRANVNDVGKFETFTRFDE